MPFLHCSQDLFRPAEAAPTGRTPATGLLSKKVNEIRGHSHRAGLIVKDDHGSGPKATAGLLDFGVIHWHIEMLFDEKIRGGAAGKNSSKPQPIAHAACVLFQLSLIHISEPPRQ